jgi:hypothetical protein
LIITYFLGARSTRAPRLKNNRKANL